MASCLVGSEMCIRDRDNVGFEKEMEKSKALARANWKGSGDSSVEERWLSLIHI